MTKPKATKKSTPAKRSKAGSGGGGAHMKILNAAASMQAKLGKNLARKQISASTGIQGGSTIRNALAKLKKGNLVDVTKDDIIVTKIGMEKADTSAVDMTNVPTTNKEHHDATKEHHALKDKAIAVFDAIIDGRTYTKDKVLEVTNSKKNSTFRNLLADLKKKGIIEDNGKNAIRLTDDMFPFEPRPEEECIVMASPYLRSVSFSRNNQKLLLREASKNILCPT